MAAISLSHPVDLINRDTHSKPRLYVVCLAADSDGDDHGAWIEADQSADDLHEAVQKILLTSPAKHPEEWAIHDYEGFFNIGLSENHDLETISALAAFLVEHGALGAALLLADYRSENIDDDKIERARAALTDCYHGIHDSEEAFTRDLFSGSYTIPKELASIVPGYLDFERLARDWFVDDFFSLKVDNNTHIFSTDY
jgi:antirestriction protein